MFYLPQPLSRRKGQKEMERGKPDRHAAGSLSSPNSRASSSSSLLDVRHLVNRKGKDIGKEREKEGKGREETLRPSWDTPPKKMLSISFIHIETRDDQRRKGESKRDYSIPLANLSSTTLITTGPRTQEGRERRTS